MGTRLSWIHFTGERSNWQWMNSTSFAAESPVEVLSNVQFLKVSLPGCRSLENNVDY
jgi:hypothetical protein